MVSLDNHIAAGDFIIHLAQSDFRYPQRGEAENGGSKGDEEDGKEGGSIVYHYRPDKKNEGQDTAADSNDFERCESAEVDTPIGVLFIQVVGNC